MKELIFMLMISLSLFQPAKVNANEYDENSGDVKIELDEKMVAGDEVEYDFIYLNRSENKAEVKLNITPSEDSIFKDIVSIAVYEDNHAIVENKKLKHLSIPLEDYQTSESRRYRVHIKLDEQADNKYTNKDDLLNIEFLHKEKEDVRTGVLTNTTVPWSLGITNFILILFIIQRKRGKRNEKA